MAKFKVIDCRSCGEAYVGHPASKFCSAACREAYHAKPSRALVCPHCGEQFTVTRTDQKFCSLQCKKAYEAEAYRKERTVEEKVCAREGCDVVFVDVPKRKYCSRACARKAKKH